MAEKEKKEKEKESSSLSSFFKKGLKKETSSTSLNNKKSQTVVIGQSSTNSISYLQSPHGHGSLLLPTNASSPSLTIPSGNSSAFSSTNTTPINRSSSNLSVKFQDTITINEPNQNDPAANSSFNRPRTSTLKAEKKERFSFITRSLRKSKINLLEEGTSDNNSNNGNNVNITINNGNGNHDDTVSVNDGVSLRDSSSSITSISSATSFNSSVTGSEKKSRRNSIFVRLLNRKSRDMSHALTEEDFVNEHQIESAGRGGGSLSATPHHLLHTASTSDLGRGISGNNNNHLDHHHQLKERSVSVLNISTTMGPPPEESKEQDHQTNELLRNQLSEANDQLSNLRVKESEWRKEKEELIRKIQLLSNQVSSSPSSSSSNFNHHHHSHLHHHNTFFNDHHDTVSSTNSPPMSKSPSIQSLSLEVSSSIAAPLSLSSSSVSFSTIGTSATTPNPSPPLQRRQNNRNRYTLAIPKWDESMNFNGNPFERLVEVLKNSCEIFPSDSNLLNVIGSIPTTGSSFSLLASSQTSEAVQQQQQHSGELIKSPRKPSLLGSNTTTNVLPSDNNNNVNNNNNNNMKEGGVTPSTSTDSICDEKLLKQHILSMCLKKMVSKLIGENTESSAVFKTFFSTYECIYNSDDLLNALIEQYHIESPQSKIRICTILKCWLQGYSITSLSNLEFINKIKDFLYGIRNTDKESQDYNFSKIIEVCNQITYLLETKIIERGGMALYSRGFAELEKSFISKRSKQKIKSYLSTSLKYNSRSFPGPTDMGDEEDDVSDMYSDTNSQLSSSIDNNSPPPSKSDRVNQLLNPTGHLSSSSIEHHHHHQTSQNHNDLHLHQRGNHSSSIETRPRSSTWSTSDIFLSIMDAPAKEIAKSITVVDYSIFICVEPSELMNGVWGKPQHKDKAMNITKLISRFNEISMNVIQTILNEEKLKDRCKVMAKFIKIAKYLHELRNYNSMMAIYAGISHSAVVRLKWTRKILPKTSQKTLQDLERLMENEENFKNYRTELKTITAPCIPFLGLILSDLTFIQEGNPDYIGTDDSNWTLNLTKLKMVYNCIKQIQLYQKNHYLLHADPRLTLLLTPNLNIFGEPVNNNNYLGLKNNNNNTQDNNQNNSNNNNNNNNSLVNNNNDDKTLIPIPDNLRDEEDDDDQDLYDEDEDDDDMDSDEKKKKEEEEETKVKKELLEQNNRLFRSFTLDGCDQFKKQNYYYNTWSPKKMVLSPSSPPTPTSSSSEQQPQQPSSPTSPVAKNPILKRLKVERSQSETHLPTVKSLLEIQTHQLLDSIIRGDLTDTESGPKSPRNNFSPTRTTANTTAALTSSSTSNTIISNISTPISSITNTTTATPPTTIVTSTSASIPSPPPSPSFSFSRPSLFFDRANRNRSKSPSPSVSVHGSPSSTSINNSTSNLPSISIGGGGGSGDHSNSPSTSPSPSLSSSQQTDMVSVGKKPIGRRKSVSTNNIFSILSPNKDTQGHHYFVSKKSHSRSSSVAASGSVNGEGGNSNPSSLPSTPPNAYVSGNSSPSPTPPVTVTNNNNNQQPHQHQHHNHNHSVSSSHNNQSFSIVAKRKSMSVMMERPPHLFAPMTDEGLFSLSLKLEPRGVKYQDLI